MLDIKVWAQMFFEDGGVTHGKYIDKSIYESHDDICSLAGEFLEDTNRKEGVLIIWGYYKIIVRKACLKIIKGVEQVRLSKVK